MTEKDPKNPASGSDAESTAKSEEQVPNPSIKPPKFTWLEKSYSTGKPKTENSGSARKER